MKQDDLIISRAQDLLRMCDQQYSTTNSGILDMHQQAIVQRNIRRPAGTECLFYGGYEDAERRIFVCLPDYAELNGDDILAVLRADTSGHAGLTHRDYLGALTGLGIRRDLAGDILVRRDGADIIILKEIADFLLLNYTQAGRAALKTQILPLSQLIVPEASVKVIRDTVASMRLDNIVSAGFGMSRSKAAEAVQRGLVFVNSVEMDKPDWRIEEKDKVVLRGKGKIVIDEIGGRSKKGREYVTIKRYI
ncbi:MAG: RNA-binding protein [Anaerovoracaceae bacterium]|jgi:RNA-binding protein YlmH